MSETPSGQSSRRASRALSRPETPLPSTPPVSYANSSSAEFEPADFVVGHPPNSPSPLAIRASNSPSTKRRQPQPKPPVDLRHLDYVSQVDDNLVCLICHSPFDQPRQVVACDHVFCKECLNQAFIAQSAPTKTCPTCRTPIAVDQPPRAVHRLVTRMLDELVTKCPNNHLGCGWSDKRTDVQDHIDLYCDHTMVDCPDKNCDLETLQKDFHLGCLHFTVSCPDCHTSMLKRELENHLRKDCANRLINCQHCQDEVVRHDLSSHIADICPKHIIPCPGEIVGCTNKEERAVMAEHIPHCPMAKMAPFFLAQNAKMEEHITAQKLLVRRFDILEGNMNAVQTLMGTGQVSPIVATQPSENFSPTQSTESQSAPFDSSTHHLLSLHETLRGDVERTTNALAEMDGRLTMTVLNEQGRTREEILHMNHAIGSMRMQLQWLISARLQTQGRVTTNPVAPAGSATARNTSGPSIQPVRRLSDPNRQDPKL